MAMPNKSLGQHWLKDRALLEDIASYADLTPGDTVLEIGPGLGTLTSVLLSHAQRVIAVEYDSALAGKLPGQFPGKQLEVINEDFLSFDLARLPAGYKVVANVPYYITTKIIERLARSSGPPEAMVLLVQQEVAEKFAARPGDMTYGAVMLQSLFDVQLGTRVPKMHFTPPPQVDSQVLVCKKRHVPIIAQKNQQAFEQVVRAGFSAPRKKLRTSLAGGLGLVVNEIDNMLNQAAINPNLRAQDLALDEWEKLL